MIANPSQKRENWRLAHGFQPPFAAAYKTTNPVSATMQIRKM